MQDEDVATKMTEAVTAIQETRQKAEAKGYTDIVAECDGVLVDLSLGNLDNIDERMNRIDKLTEKHKLETQPVLKRKFVPPMHEGEPYAIHNINEIIKDTKPLKPEQLSLEQLAIGALVFGASPKFGAMPDIYEDRLNEVCKTKFGASFRTMVTATEGIGAELLERQLFAQLWNDILFEAEMTRLFGVTVMPSQVFDLPTLGEPSTLFRKPAGEGQAVTATDLTTGKFTLTAYELKAQVDVGDWLEQDAVIALIPQIRSTLVRNASGVIDEVVLNGDNTTGKLNINYYDAAGSDIATDSRFLIGFDGLIHYALTEHATAWKTSLGTLEIADFPTMIALLGKYAVKPANVGLIMDVWTWAKALGITEFLAMQSYGSQATIISGGLGKPFGMNLIVTDKIAKSDANGRIDQTAENNTKGRMLMVNKDMWKLGVRQPIRVATERSESKGITSLVCTMRIGLQCFGDRTDAKYSHTALGYNITV